MREAIAEGFTKDASKITYFIVAFFIYGFFASLRVAFYLQAEFAALKRMNSDQRISDVNASDGAAMLDAALERIRKGNRIEIRNLITAYGTKIKARVDNISVISGMLVTVGLLGTVLGLTITVSGLDQVLSSGSSDYAEMKAGLNQTVSGMGTAFYTTLFGALLGGVVLKVLGAEMKKSASQLVAGTLHFSELFLAPKISETASESLANLEERVDGIGQKLEQLGSCFAGVIDLIDSKQVALATGLGDLLATVEQTVEMTNSQANDRVEALVASVDGAVRQSDERTGALASMLDEASRTAEKRLEVASTSVEHSVANANRLADERTEAVVATSQAVMDETHRKADERLEVLSQTIDKTTAETNRLADERLGALLGTFERTAEDTHREANERLVGLVDQVGKSIDQTRREAEERLGAKASELAQKLTEAASVLAALSEPSPEKEPSQTEE